MPTNAEQFLNAELAHAEVELTRLRRIAAQFEDQLAAQGLSEIEVYEKLALSKPYRQIQRDQVVFQQMWLRVHRHLTTTTRCENRPAPGVSQGAHHDLEQTLQDLEREVAQNKPTPFRKPLTPSPNQPCSCGSNIKYKKCCGHPLRQQTRAA